MGPNQHKHEFSKGKILYKPKLIGYPSRDKTIILNTKYFSILYIAELTVSPNQHKHESSKGKILNKPKLIGYPSQDKTIILNTVD